MTTASRQQTAESRQQTADSKQQTAAKINSHLDPIESKRRLREARERPAPINLEFAKKYVEV
jgi:hypothetical protein